MNATPTAVSIQDFNRALRGLAAAVSPAEKLYAGLLRENVEDVVAHAFPLYSRRLGPDSVRRQADDFLRRHHASRPAHHQIATEFLLFMQPRLPAAQRQLLEYEWTLFQAEIDEARVEESMAAPASPDARLTRNPTLVCIQLDLPAENLQGPFAVFRDARHRVWQKPLTPLDARLLALLDQPRAYAELASAAGVDAARLRDWIDAAAALGLIRSQPA